MHLEKHFLEILQDSVSSYTIIYVVRSSKINNFPLPPLLPLFLWIDKSCIIHGLQNRQYELSNDAERRWKHFLLFVKTKLYGSTSNKLTATTWKCCIRDKFTKNEKQIYTLSSNSGPRCYFCTVLGTQIVITCFKGFLKNTLFW